VEKARGALGIIKNWCTKGLNERKPKKSGREEQEGER